MKIPMKPLRLILQSFFYLFTLILFISRSAWVGFSHDENQFIAAGQLLADHGLLPYINYPYTHMPYGALFYAITAKLSGYDFLAGRILNAFGFLICGLLIVQAFRLLSGTRPSLLQLLWEFAVVYIFINHPVTNYVIGAALNHALAALFALLGLLFFIAGTQKNLPLGWAAFSSGALVCIAALIRFNYASLIVVVLFLWMLYQFALTRSQWIATLRAFAAGVVGAALPALVLFALAPGAFYYGNIVYIRLNTIYYQQVLARAPMDLVSKINSFLAGILARPLDLVLYLLLLYVGIRSLLDYRKGRASADINRLAVASFAFTLFLAAFAPTPTQQHYFFDPLPFLLVILALLGHDLQQKIRWGYALACVASLALLFLSTRVINPLDDLARLSDPSDWTPLQVHDFAWKMKQYVPQGRILTLLPMIPLEAGYDVYPFTATGPFSWRTSLLLTPQRRLQYGVTSPDELTALLTKSPPAGILTGFESSNAGFTFAAHGQGGLEAPFVAYAQANGYKPIPMAAPFLERTVTLWVKGP